MTENAEFLGLTKINERNHENSKFDISCIFYIENVVIKTTHMFNSIFNTSF